MTQVSCPNCKRKGTYSPKHKQCAACGLGYPIAPKVVSVVPDDVRPEVLHDGRITPVPAVTPVTEEPVTNVTTVTPVTEPMYVQIVVEPGEVCPTCDERKPSEKALKQRAYRERKEG